MPTFEERLAALEQNAMKSIHDLQADVTIMMGVIGSQGQDIKRIVQHLGVMDNRLSVMDGRLNIVEQHMSQVDARLNHLEAKSEEHTALLNEHTVLLNGHTALLNEHTVRFDRIETVLAQILERLPEKS